MLSENIIRGSAVLNTFFTTWYSSCFFRFLFMALALFCFVCFIFTCFFRTNNIKSNDVAVNIFHNDPHRLEFWNLKGRHERKVSLWRINGINKNAARVLFLQYSEGHHVLGNIEQHSLIQFFRLGLGWSLGSNISFTNYSVIVAEPDQEVAFAHLTWP